MSVRSQVAFAIDAARNAFRDDPDTTLDCAEDLRLMLTAGPWHDNLRTEPYYAAIVAFVRDWQPPLARSGF